jgi:predicted amidohydrolase YtcJ
MNCRIRTFKELTRAPLPEVIRMATLTPTKLLTLDGDIGSLEVGKRAGFVVMSEELQVERVDVGGVRLVRPLSNAIKMVKMINPAPHARGVISCVSQCESTT